MELYVNFNPKCCKCDTMTFHSEDGLRQLDHVVGDETSE